MKIACILGLRPLVVVAAPVDRCDQIETYQTEENFSGDTVASFGNQYDVDVCAGAPMAAWLPASGAADEQVVKLRVPSPCSLTVSMTGQASGGNFNDPAPYIATTCPIADPGVTNFLDATCLAAVDQTGQLGTETFVVSLQAETDYFLYLDGFSAARGPYTVALSGCTLVGDGQPDAIFANGFED